MTDISFNPHYSLATLVRAVADVEIMLGPITAIGIEGTQTAASFDDTMQPPPTPPRIRTLIGGQPPRPGEICKGTVFILNQKIGVAVYRT